ncbi:MAG: triose-phosphate isomerase [Thermodesulfobacteriota bacterium]
MARPLIAGNWKMNNILEEGVELVLVLKELLSDVDSVEILISPPFTLLYRIKQYLEGSNIHLAAQNLFWKEKGAYTGEVSTKMVKDVGCEYVILGHSERRKYFGETDSLVNNKVRAALKEGLKPILCVGETLENREAGKAIAVVENQVREGLKGVLRDQMCYIDVAYEPVWAIGTGKTATPEQAEEVHHKIKEILYDLFDSKSLKDTRIIYGGSVTPDNVDNLMVQPDIDGALVGGASLKSDSFARIVRFKALSS